MRHRGLSRSRACKGLLKRGLSESYPKHLERMLAVAVNRAKALFAQEADLRLSALEWIWAVCGKTDRPLNDLNRFSLDRGAGAVCFCRSSSLTFDRGRVAGESSHNLVSTEPSAAFIDSG